MGAFYDGRFPSTAPKVPSDFELEVAFTNLTFANPMGLIPVPGSNRLAVWEREGRVWTIENDPGATEKRLILDLSVQCQGWGAAGLFSIAFHPGFETNRWLFVYYTWVLPGTVVGDMVTEAPELSPGNYRDRLSRFTLPEEGTPSLDSEVVLVDQITDSLFHSGSSLFFHPEDGFLYWCNGDDNRPTSQVIDQNLLGGVFRIDVDQRGGDVSHPIPRQPDLGMTGNYFIPNDNPFVGEPNALEEFYALGLRSPYRMSLDSRTGRIFIGDVGNFSREEVNVIEPTDPPGLNFQWNKAEGAHGALTPPYPGVSKGPILDYSRSDGGCVIGGYVYRGDKFAVELGGRYIFGDNSSGAVWAMDESTIPPGKVRLATVPRGPGPAPHPQYLGLSSFGLDHDGEIYLCQLSSTGARIYKLARRNATPPEKGFPKLLSETGLFADIAELVPSPQLIPYAVNSPLWSDGAGKFRWFTIPSNTTIGFAPSGEWQFPAGSVFVKHFELPMEGDGQAPARRLETRVMVRSAEGGVFGATYKWRPDYSDAELLDASVDEVITVGTGEQAQQRVWHYPSPSECLQCHTPASQGVLGLNTRQLNRDFLFPSGISRNQIQAYNEIGLLYPAPDLEAIEALPRLVHITNTTASLEVRSRSYLDSNCSHCHRPGAGRTYWDARFETPLELSGILNGPVAQSFGISGARTIVPGRPEKSIILHRVGSLDPSAQMPPIAKNVLDTEALAVLEQYIAGLPETTNGLPSGWQSVDIGTVETPGSVSFSSGALNILTGKGEIFGTADRFTYVYQELEGDGELSARMASVSGHEWARVGPMIRASLEPGSPHAFACLGNRKGVFIFYRSIENGSTSYHGLYGITAPVYGRIVRSGDRFTTFYSVDGTNWIQTGTQIINMPSRVYIGFAASGLLERGSFIIDRMQFVNVPPIDLAPSLALQVAAAGGSLVAGPVRLIAESEDPDGYVPMVEFFQGPTRLGQATEPPFELLVHATPGEHEFSARAYDNHGVHVTAFTPTIEIQPLEIRVERAGVDGLELVHGGNPGIVYLAEASSDLVAWMPVATNAPVDGVVRLTFPYSSSATFFRVRPR